MKKIFRGYLICGDGITFDNTIVSDTILLTTEDLTRIDGPISEMVSNHFNEKKVSLKYYISDKQFSIEELSELFLIQTFSGELKGEFYAYDIRYSEVSTGYISKDDLIIGGHDLMREFRSYLGKFIHLEIETVKDNLNG